MTQPVFRAHFVLAVLLLAAVLPAVAGQTAIPPAAANLARAGTARSWLPTSQPSPYAPAERANDGDPFSFWASTEPTLDPPKDLGIEWSRPRRIGSVLVRFYSLGYQLARDGWSLEAQVGGQWRKLKATLSGADCEWWTFRFPPVSTRAVRLVITRYAENRPAISEFEVYAGKPPRPRYRRPPLLDGAFWAFHYPHWAERFATEQALAAEVAVAHRVGLDTLILYTGEAPDGSFGTVVPDTVFPQAECWRGRDPLAAILTAADRLRLRVYLSDAPPAGTLGTPDPTTGAALEQRLYEYRRQLLTRYGHHRSLVGYYLNYECVPDNTGNNPTLPARKAEELAAFVKGVLPRLQVIQPVGLYRWRDTPDAPWHPVTPVELRRFWRPFLATAPHIDAYLVIDGVGTGLAPLAYTDQAQACLRALCDEQGKEMWTDVECAEMGQRYVFYTIGRLVPSLEVAARHASRIVAFDYINYLSPNNGREPSRRLYEGYAAYRRRLARR
ncbi:MAG: hypothetical protein GX774_22065 [Armatimonadetes bacterium]|nr:hypothetical protein [Armatimonadota bacterium]